MESWMFFRFFPYSLLQFLQKHHSPQRCLFLRHGHLDLRSECLQEICLVFVVDIASPHLHDTIVFTSPFVSSLSFSTFSQNLHLQPLPHAKPSVMHGHLRPLSLLLNCWQDVDFFFLFLPQEQYVFLSSFVVSNKSIKAKRQQINREPIIESSTIITNIWSTFNFTSWIF